ncbi:MAG: hypothetical protein Q8Q37_01785 [bacterium]|nr:hypothetical protein [bacterium]
METNWHGNNGYFRNGADKLPDNLICDICATEAKVGKRIFACPNVKEPWHKKIARLKRAVRLSEKNKDRDLRKKKLAATKEIERLLKKHITR